MIYSLLHNRSIRFLAITAQFALLVLVIRTFELVSPNFGNLMVLAWGGFVVNHFLPQRFRLPWFVLLSLASLALVAQYRVAACVVVAGSALIAICHLPVALAIRVVMLLGAAVTLAWLATGPIELPVNPAAWSILGAMFMFRMMSYLYELKHQTAPFGPMRAMAYFFMMPNICFLFFPLVDYRTFCDSHFKEDSEQTYITGLRWMLRGVVQLLCYRLVYQLAVLDPLDTTDLLSVTRFMLSTYLLYLQVSGWFHLIVGLLRMYGFALPETHHHYFLASSFTDFWRRINIYWKDFLLKLFFYPAYFQLKRLGSNWAMVIATLFAFFVTWLLHSYQFFWLRGEWLVTWQDSLFWTLLALLVLANALWELKAGRPLLVSQKRNWTVNLVAVFKTIGTFVVICALWTVWSSKSSEELLWLAGAAGNAPWSQVAIVSVGLIILGSAGVFIERCSFARSECFSTTGLASNSFWKSTATIAVGASALLLIGIWPQEPAGMPSMLSQAIAAVRSDGLNQFDLAVKRRGYYEELDVSRMNKNLTFLAARTRRDFAQGLQYKTNDFLLRRLEPNARAQFSGGTVTINRWGMRDDDYEQQKPDGTYRIVLLGSSHEFGLGLSDGLTFDALAEERLNKQSTVNEKNRHFEILNFANQGYSVFQRLYLLEQEGLAFQPDAVFFCVNANEDINLFLHLSVVWASKYACPYPIVQDAFATSGITDRVSRTMFDARLKPHVLGLTMGAVKEFARICRRQGAMPCVVFRPSPTAISGFEHELEVKFVVELRELTRSLDVPLLDLTAAYQNSAVDSIILSLADDHTNERGHRLLAAELYKQMTSSKFQHAWRRDSSPSLPLSRVNAQAREDL